MPCFSKEAGISALFGFLSCDLLDELLTSDNFASLDTVALTALLPLYNRATLLELATGYPFVDRENKSTYGIVS